jgi:hypothetical protein
MILPRLEVKSDSMEKLLVFSKKQTKLVENVSEEVSQGFLDHIFGHYFKIR